MKAHTFNLINAAALVFLGTWGALGSDSPTAWIPVFFGIALLGMHNGIKKENKVIAHIAVILTLVVLLAMFMPLKGAMGRGDQTAVIRVSIMILTGVLAMVAFVKSFIDARRNKAS